MRLVPSLVVASLAVASSAYGQEDAASPAPDAAAPDEDSPSESPGSADPSPQAATEEPAGVGGGSPSDDAPAPTEGEDSLRPEREDTGDALADRIEAVSRRVFIKRLRFEAAPTVGFSVNDAFYQRISGGARFSFHIFESLAIDGGGVVNPVHVPLPTVRFLRQSANDEAVATAPFWGYGDIGLTFSPIYGKFSLMSEMVIHFDAFISGGAGFIVDGNRRFLWGMEVTNDLIPTVHPAAELGVGARIFLFKWFAIRFDVRDYAYVHNRGPAGLALQNLALVHVAASFWFPLGFEYGYQEGK